MELYNIGLFLHIAGAVVLLSYGFVMPLLKRRIANTATVTGLREWVEATSKYGKMGPPAAVLVLLSGIYMTLSQHSFGKGWIVVSLVLFVLSGAIAGGVLDKHFTKVLEAAEQAPEGPVPAELRALAMDRKVWNFESLMFGFDIAILFNMTNKPGWTGALIATAVGLLVAGAIIARHSRSHAASPAVASH